MRVAIPRDCIQIIAFPMTNKMGFEVNFWVFEVKEQTVVLPSVSAV